MFSLLLKCNRPFAISFLMQIVPWSKKVEKHSSNLFIQGNGGSWFWDLSGKYKIMSLLGAPQRSSSLERLSIVGEVRGSNPMLKILFQVNSIAETKRLLPVCKLLSLCKIRGCLTVLPQREGGPQGKEKCQKIMSTTCCQNNNNVRKINKRGHLKVVQH